ncbi:MAG: Lrp/AsnC family transcriptional regulator [Nanoarchaeota archaeon]|nr:Lrp/AsnC family transcriptional regulator [Nanoarchaeota archaeon]
MKSAKHSISQNELLVLRELRMNSRQSLSEISRKTSIPLTTVFDKVRKLENTLIIKHVSFLDYSKLGFNIKVAIFVKANKKEELRKFLQGHKNVNSLHRISSNYDYFIEAVFRNMSELYGFLGDIEKFDIKEINHYYVENIKEEEMLLY